MPRLLLNTPLYTGDFGLNSVRNQTTVLALLQSTTYRNLHFVRAVIAQIRSPALLPMDGIAQMSQSVPNDPPDGICGRLGPQPSEAFSATRAQPRQHAVAWHAVQRCNVASSFLPMERERNFASKFAASVPCRGTNSCAIKTRSTARCTPSRGSSRLAICVNTFGGSGTDV